MTEAGIARYGASDPFDLPDDDLVTLLAYILCRRSPDGFRQSLAPASARDAIFLANLRAMGDKRSTGDEDLDAMNAFLSGEG